MMTHWADSDNYDSETVGRIRIISTCVTESRMKTAVKTGPGTTVRVLSAGPARVLSLGAGSVAKFAI